MYTVHINHKKDMRSIVLKIHQTISKGFNIKIVVESHNKSTKMENNVRDFIYVKDVVST